MPSLLQGIVSVIDTFYKYATWDRECDTLNKAELKELLENEFQQILKVRTQLRTENSYNSLLHPFLPFCHICQTPTGLSTW